MRTPATAPRALPRAEPPAVCRPRAVARRVRVAAIALTATLASLATLTTAATAASAAPAAPPVPPAPTALTVPASPAADATATGATAADRCPAGKLCVFRYPGYQGAMKILTASAPRLGADWNDKISSVVNKSGLWATFYPKPDHRTDSDYVIVTPHNGAIDLGESFDGRYDNVISSYRVATTEYEVVQGVPYMDWYTYPEVRRPEGLPEAGRFGDLDGDRRPDLLERADDGRLWFLSGNGDAHGITKGRLLGGGWNAMTQLVRHGDYDSDGREDVFARDAYGVLWCYPGTGTGALGARVRVGAGWNAMREISAAGDLTGDGRRDLLARDAAGVLWTYPGNGKGAFTARRKVGGGWNAMNQLASPGDLTGDGRSDLLARDGQRALWLYPGTGTGAFGARKKLPYTWSADEPVIATGDLDGDGRADFMRPVGYQVFRYLGNGAGGIGGPQADTLWDSADRVRVF